MDYLSTMANSILCSQSSQQSQQSIQVHSNFIDLNSLHTDTVAHLKCNPNQQYQQVQKTPGGNQFQQISFQIQLELKKGNSETIIQSLWRQIQFLDTSGKKQQPCSPIQFHAACTQEKYSDTFLAFINHSLFEGTVFINFCQLRSTSFRQSSVQMKQILSQGTVAQKVLRGNKFRCAQKKSTLLRTLSTPTFAEDKAVQLSHHLFDVDLQETDSEQKSKVVRFLKRCENKILLSNQLRSIISLRMQLQNSKYRIQISLKQYKLSCKFLLRQHSLIDKNKMLSVRSNQQKLSNSDQFDIIREKIEANEFCQEIIVPNHKSSQFKTKQQNTTQYRTNLLKYIRQIINIIRKDDMLALKSYWNHGMHSQLSFIKNNWNIYQHELQKQMKKMITILDYKIHRFKLNLQAKNKQNIYFCKQNSSHLSLFELLYPGIARSVSQYLKLLQLNSFQNNFIQFKQKKFQHSSMKINCLKIFNEEIMHFFGIQSNRLDELIVFYVEELILCKLNNQKKQLQIEENQFLQPLKKCIFDYRGSTNYQYQLQDLLNSIKAKVAQIKLIKKSAHTKQEFQTIQLRRDPEMKCLGCSQFFQFKSKILDQSVNQTPIKVFPSIKTLKDYDSLLKNEICAMLNSYGGVIFFGCQGQYKTAIALGQNLTQHNKQDISQILQHMLKSIYPKIQYNNEVQLTFVPIIQQTNIQKANLEEYKGEENMLKMGQLHYSQNYMKGVYMARIRVNPINNYLTYCWERKEGSESRYFSAVLQNGKTKNIKGSQLTKLMKRRFKQNFIPQVQNLTSLQKRLLSKPQSCFDKTCLLPQQGYKISEIDSVHQCMSQKKEDKYRYMSLMIVKEKYLNDVKQKLSKKMRFFIQQRFRSYGFKSALCTYVLYHDNSFDQLLKLVSYSQEFVYEQKMTIVIYISQYLKFKETFSPPSTKIMNKSLLWLRRQFPNQTIRFYAYHTQRGIEYYAQTNTRISTLFMYYFFNDQKIKTFLKSPPKLSELSPQQKNFYWREISYSNANTLGWS